MQWRLQKIVPIGTPLEVLQTPIKYSVHSLRVSCELEFGTGVDAVKVPTDRAPTWSDSTYDATNCEARTLDGEN